RCSGTFDLSFAPDFLDPAKHAVHPPRRGNAQTRENNQFTGETPANAAFFGNRSASFNIAARAFSFFLVRRERARAYRSSRPREVLRCRRTPWIFGGVCWLIVTRD